MEMLQLLEKIKIKRIALVRKNIFKNDQITLSAKTSFVCCNCGNENQIEIIPYISGFPIFQIYNESAVLTKKELLDNKIVATTSLWMLHFGELTVNDLPTLYFGTNCEKCNSNYFCVFCYGEKQPGLTILEISGIWEYKLNTELLTP